MQTFEMRNKMKEKLMQGKLVVGTGINWPDPTLVEDIGRCNFDFFRIEGEHGVASYQDLVHIVRVSQLYDVTPIARVPGNVEHEILHYLDAGIMGVTIPHTKNRIDAKRAVHFGKHYPLGNRGDNFPGRAKYYGSGLSQKEYYQRVNDTTMIIALIEDYEGVENIESIIRTPGIDALDVGPYDLAQSMGLPEQKYVDEAVERIVLAAVKANMPIQVGTAGTYRNPANMKKYLDMGCRMFMVGGFFHHGVQECWKVINELREPLGI